mgnify:CR=1
MEMSLFVDYHGISEIAKLRITLIVCLSSATVGSSNKSLLEKKGIMM